MSSNDNTDEAREVAAPDLSLTSLLNKSEIDQQISTARKYPRSIKKFVTTAIDMATLDEETAADCIYALPRKERDPITGQTQTKMIEGPSARLAEIAHHAWGNCRAGARVIDDRGDFVTAQGVFHDLESNSQVTFEVRRRITNKQGHRFNQDMVAVTGNAAASIALRNAVFKGIPKAFWNKIYVAARTVVAGDSMTLVNRRSEALNYLQKLGATAEMVVEVLGVASVEDIGLEQLATLRGLATSIKEGEITVEEAFTRKDASGGATGGKEDNKKNPGAPAPGATTKKAKDALKKNDDQKNSNDPPDAAALVALRAAMDKAGVGENAMIEKFTVEKLEVLTREQYDEAMRYIAGLLAGPGTP